MDIIIRTAQNADFSLLLPLWTQLDNHHARLQPAFFRNEPRPPRPREQFFKILRSSHQCLLLAEKKSESAVVGLLLVSLYQTPSEPYMVNHKRAYVEDLVVQADYRREGIGQQLMQAAESWAKEQGAQQILLTVWSGNTEAERFYQKSGYQPVNCVLGRWL